MAIIAIDKLTQDEKLQLIEDLVDSLDHDAAGLPAQHRAELERRLATLEGDAARAVRWENLTRFCSSATGDAGACRHGLGAG